MTATGPAVFARPHAQPLPPETCLARIWREVLDLSGSLDPHADFFALGGDSLRSLQLSGRIQETFGREIAAQEFFAEPTLTALTRLVEDEAWDGTTESTRQPPPAAPPNLDPVAWPLPVELRQQQLSVLEGWDGMRPTRDRLVVGRNTRSTRPPLFWVFNNADDFVGMTRILGPDQPLYALRSGSRIAPRTEDVFQALALRYVHEILERAPAGPLFLGGSCHCAAIALAIAQHLIRRGRHVPLLVLAEWEAALQPYTGGVLLIHGRESRSNPYGRYRDPETLWQRAFIDFTSVEVPGGHYDLISNAGVEALGAVLEKQFARALSQPPRLLTRSACQAKFHVDDVPAILEADETRRIQVTVTNASGFAWDGESGLMLRNAWTKQSGKFVSGRTGRMDGQIALPALAAGAEVTLALPVTAPRVEGKRLRLVIDLGDEGRTWTDTFRHEALRAEVRIVAPR